MGMKTHPYGIPKIVVMLADVLFPIMTDWGLPVRKSRRLSQMVQWRPSVDSLWVCGGRTVLKEDL